NNNATTTPTNSLIYEHEQQQDNYKNKKNDVNDNLKSEQDKKKLQKDDNIFVGNYSSTIYGPFKNDCLSISHCNDIKTEDLEEDSQPSNNNNNNDNDNDRILLFSTIDSQN